MSRANRSMADQSEVSHRSREIGTWGKKRSGFFCTPSTQVYLVLLLLVAPLLACSRSGSASPDPTLTPTATPTPLPTGTPMPEATIPPTPTLAPTPKVSPTRRVLVLTDTPAPTQTATPAPTAASPATAGSGNLLRNASFEGTYAPYQGKPEWKVPEGWVPWSFQQGGSDFEPEFKPAEAPFLNRVHDGARALQYFKSFGTYHAGVFQKVSVTPGVKLRFTIFGQAWSRDTSAQGCPSDIAQSCNPAFMGMRIGIDPLGGSSPKADSIEWSAMQSPTEGWLLFSVEVVAKGDLVTVFAWSAPNQPRANQDTYWDDAQLVVIP